jgi:hypothetical protein
MRRRLLALVTVALLALGIAVAVLAARPDGADEVDKDACRPTTFRLEDPEGPKVMTYHGNTCDEEGSPDRQ